MWRDKSEKFTWLKIFISLFRCKCTGYCYSMQINLTFSKPQPVVKIDVLWQAWNFWVSPFWCDHSIQLSSLALRLVYDHTWATFFLWKDAHKSFGCFLWHICSTVQPGHAFYRSESLVIFEFAIPALKVVSSRLHETPFDLKKKNSLYFKEFC